MNYLLFAPWKTSSTLLVSSLEPNFELVIKETFHENYFESDVIVQSLSDKWHLNRKSSPSWYKYILNFEECVAAKQWCADIARDIVKFSLDRKRGVCFQIAESAQLTSQIFNEIKRIGSSEFKIAKSNYDTDIQGMAFMHNFLEGNPYFVANAINFFVINCMDQRSHIVTTMKKLSNTGMVMLAQHIASVMPMKLVITTIKYFTTNSTLFKLQDNDVVETITYEKYDSTTMWDRYIFLQGEFSRAGSHQHFLELHQFLDALEISRSAFANMQLSKDLVSFRSDGEFWRARVDYCRSFLANIQISPDGKLRPLNVRDPSRQCIALNEKLHIRQLVLQNARNIRQLQIEIDGELVNFNVEKFENQACECLTEISIDIYLDCTQAICLTALSNEWPEIFIVFSYFDENRNWKTKTNNLTTKNEQARPKINSDTPGLSDVFGAPVPLIINYPLSISERLNLTVSCADCAGIPKVDEAGTIQEENGIKVQIMHEGTRVIAGGYYGQWMSEVIERLRGHHEPQEELIFHTLLKQARSGTLMVELGSYWAYYSNWYLGEVENSRVVCVEPDENRMLVGKKNIALNNRDAIFHLAAVGGKSCNVDDFVRESDGTRVNIPVWDFAKLQEEINYQSIELLHMDVQGAELPFLESIAHAAYRDKIRFIVISTHHESISGSATTHRDCLKLLIELGAFILCEHAVDESFSGDGLIVASFRVEDSNLSIPSISLCPPEQSLFGPDPQRPSRTQSSLEISSIQSPLPEFKAYMEPVNTISGTIYVHRSDSVIGPSLKRTGTFQTDKVDEILLFLQSKLNFSPDLFVDIGANIGTHILHAMKSCGFKRGLAFEPDPVNHALLKRNIAQADLLEKVQTYQLALSSRSGAATLELSESNFGDHRIRVFDQKASTFFKEDERRLISVLSDTCDKFFAENSIVLSINTLIWMDVQGHEGQVLSACKKLFSGREKPYVVCEFWPYGLDRAGGKDMFFDFLRSCAFVYEINQKNWQACPESDLARLETLYQRMLLAANNDDFSHTDILCIL